MPGCSAASCEPAGVGGPGEGGGVPWGGPRAGGRSPADGAASGLQNCVGPENEVDRSRTDEENCKTNIDNTFRAKL